MDSAIRRHILGAVALLLLISAVVLLVGSERFGFEKNVGQMAGTICLRVGLTLGALWLAFPQILAIKAKYPPRLLLAVLGGSLVVLAYPKSFPIVLVLVAVIGAVESLGWFLKPPPGKKAKRRSRPRR
jgi:hypothetical protein